jgi:organic radical activating enzyme|tara:strand:- start:263 stop:1441 length:1179 start_codon:yes stop_codon:yes gene_type:complete
MIKGCILPWIMLFGDVKGQYKLCCHIPTDHKVGDHTQPISTIFNSERYKEVRREFLDGKIPEDCKVPCYAKEALGGLSNRQQVNKRFQRFSKLQEYTNKDGSVKNDPIYLDIRFGNKCNFKCRICGPRQSSGWFKDASKVTAFQKESQKPQLEDYYTDSPEFWEYLSKIKKSLKYIYFAGGEPLIMDGHYKVLEWLIENNKTEVELTYNTNLSTLTYKNYNVFDLWKNFNQVYLWPSVDGYKEHCEYGRTNFGWENFENNLLEVKQYVSTVSCCCSVYSIMTSPDLLVYLNKLNIKTYLSCLSHPEFQDMRLLPGFIKEKITKKFELVKEKLTLDGDQLGNIDTTLSYLNNDIENKSLKLKQFKTYNEEVDAINNTSFSKTYPELAEWYEAI